MSWGANHELQECEQLMMHPSAQSLQSKTAYAGYSLSWLSQAQAHRLVYEHAIVRIEQLSDQQLEELLLDPSCINAILPNEVHPQRLEQVPCRLTRNLIQGILQVRTGSLGCRMAAPLQAPGAMQEVLRRICSPLLMCSPAEAPIVLGTCFGEPQRVSLLDSNLPRSGGSCVF